MRSPRPLWLLAVIVSLSLGSHAAGRGRKLSGDVTLLIVGGAAGDLESPTLQKLQTRLADAEPTRTVVVFTGNYASGELPEEGASGRAEAERAILAHVSATREFADRGGRVYYLAGQRDFAEGGSRAVQRLKAFLNQAYRTGSQNVADAGSSAKQGDGPGDDSAVDVMPLGSCGDPVLLELTDRVGLALLNSQWWMQDWSNDSQANQGCGVKSRSEFEDSLLVVFKEYKHRRLIIASHHPLRSDGEFGGSFTGEAHLHPAPILGSFWVWAREAGLIAQYQNHPMVRAYREALFQVAQRDGAYIFASGHDENIQAVHVQSQLQVISGSSGRRTGPVVDAAPGDFAAAAAGWAEMKFDASGEGDLRLISGEADQTLFEARLPPVPPAGAPPSEPPPFPEGKVEATYTKHHIWQPDPVTRFFVGSFYSKAFALQLDYDALDLKSAHGGLTPHDTGGGFETNSLKLEDVTGGEWAARSVAKDPTRYLPWPMNQTTFLNTCLEYGFTATHPEGALAVPPLADALGVLHAVPRLYYLPDQNALGAYRGFIDGGVVLLEQRPKIPKKGGVLPAGMIGEPSPYGSTKIKSGTDTIDRLLEDPMTNRIDQEAMLRARLLDNLVGDWDRHKGQWSFAVTPNEDGSKTYRPIPRDRDQALANYDGLGLTLAHLALPGTRALRPFNDSFGDPSWLNFNGRHMDHLMLNRITHQRWIEIAKESQAALTDEVIDRAMATWHPAAYALDGAQIAAALKKRRDKLVEAAEDYFAVVNHDVDITGSPQDDVFDVWFQEGGAVRVAVQAAQGQANAPFFDRIFSPDETAELRLYGLAGDDRLVVHGRAKTPITVRFVGGEGRDTVVAAPEESASQVDAPAIHFYDLTDEADPSGKNGGVIDPSVQVRDDRSRRASLNEYDAFENHDPDTGAVSGSLLSNPDDGLYVSGTYVYTVQGYKKVPSAARHQLSLAFATREAGFAFGYGGLFPQSAGWLDQQVDLTIKSPTYTRDYYGMTDTYIPEPAQSDYYRLHQADYEGRYGLSHGLDGDRGRVGVQLLGQAVNTQDTSGRFVSVAPGVADALGVRYFAGTRLFASINTYDNLALPNRGVSLNASAVGRVDATNGGEPSATLKGSASAAIPIDRTYRFVLISRVGVEGIVGDHPFYFAPTLGGADLRAYHLQQFAGDLAVAQTSDLRIDVLRFHTGLPSSAGLTLSFDHGRVFGSAVTGKIWHVDYGGGVWWSVLDTVAVSVNYYRSVEGASVFSFGVGQLFGQTRF